MWTQSPTPGLTSGCSDDCHHDDGADDDDNDDDDGLPAHSHHDKNDDDGDNDDEKKVMKVNCVYTLPTPRFSINQDALKITMIKTQDHHKYEDDHDHNDHNRYDDDDDPTLAHFSPPQGRPIIDLSKTLPPKASLFHLKDPVLHGEFDRVRCFVW